MKYSTSRLFHSKTRQQLSMNIKKQCNKKIYNQRYQIMSNNRYDTSIRSLSTQKGMNSNIDNSNNNDSNNKQDGSSISSFRWEDNHNIMKSTGIFHAVTFNMLAPCYKRLMDKTSGNPIGRRRREADSDWRPRALKTLDFFEKELLTRYHLISLQELWLEKEYLDMFQALLNRLGFQLYSFRRHPTRKEDAVAIIVKNSILQVKQSQHVHLCDINNRVALILWMQHVETGRNIIVANTHLSFPHNMFDKVNQVNQMSGLLEAMNDFAINKCHCPNATRIVMGDFNVESESDVCDHLRDEGYYSALETSPPKLIGGSGNPIFASSNSVVTHRTHRNEDLGVDHIFFKPEITYHDDINVDTTFATETSILPHGSPCTIWDELFTVSDHRPVGSSFVFGKSEN